MKKQSILFCIFLLPVLCHAQMQPGANITQRVIEDHGVLPAEDIVEESKQLRAAGFASEVISKPPFKQSTKDAWLRIPGEITGSYPFYINTLWLQFSCGESIASAPYKFKNIKWHFKDRARHGVNGGEQQTDQSGKFKYQFKSDEEITGKVIEVEAGAEKKQVTLGQGPYEIFLPVDSCINKK